MTTVAPSRPVVGGLRTSPVRPLSPVRAVPAPTGRVRARAIFTGRNIAIIVFAFVALYVVRLSVSIATEATTYTMVETAQERDSLVRDAEYIEEQLGILNSPQYLSTMAHKLGMVSNSRPAYLRVSDGKVWGDPHVVSTGTIDKTAIANSLESTVVLPSSSKGVAKPKPVDSGAQSVTKPIVESTGGIPAPNTH